jgi:putative peptidoglycan lipid II flippase
MEFPLGILGVALSTVILPRLSRRQAEQDSERFSAELDWGLRVALVFGVPAAIGLAVLAAPMIATLFQSDVFDAHDVAMAQRSLVAYALGIQAFILIKVLAPGFYACQDTRTPVRIGIIAMVANMVFNLLLIYPLQHAGLALATSLAAYLNALLLLRALRGQQIYRPATGWAILLIRVIGAGILMGALLWWLAPPTGAWTVAARADRVVWLLGLVVAGAVGYFAALLVLGWRPRELLHGTSREG